MGSGSLSRQEFNELQVLNRNLAELTEELSRLNDNLEEDDD